MCRGKLLASLLTVLIIWVCFLPTSLIAQRPPNDPKSFVHYLSCTFDDSLKVVERIRLPKHAEKFRVLKTGAGSERVSLLDGYTVVFVNRDNGFKVNMKIEQSDSQDYLRDKQVIVESLKWVLSTSIEMDARGIKTSRMKRFETYGLDRATLEIGNVIGTYVFFSDTDQKIITIYFVNQGPKVRKFQTIEEYGILRDKFLNRYATCAD